MENTTKDTSEAISKARAAGSQALSDGYDSIREYGEKSLDYTQELSDSLAEFVRRNPLVSVGAALLIGYVAKHFFRRIPS